MTKLLMASDLSARSDCALQRAIMLAAALGADLEIMNVVDESLPHLIVEFQLEAARAALTAQISSLPVAKGVVKTLRVVRGDGFASILRRAERIQSTLIVIGIHRHFSWTLFRGTTCERIIRLGSIPVLVVRHPVVHPYSRVLVGLDLGAPSRSALAVALTLAPNAKFQLVHAFHVPFKSRLAPETVEQIAREDEAQLRRAVEPSLQKLSELGIDRAQLEINAVEGDPRTVLPSQATHFKPDLIAIGANGRKGIAKAILGSVAETLLANPSTDMLVVKDDETAARIGERLDQVNVEPNAQGHVSSIGRAGSLAHDHRPAACNVSTERAPTGDWIALKTQSKNCADQEVCAPT